MWRHTVRDKLCDKVGAITYAKSHAEEPGELWMLWIIITNYELLLRRGQINMWNSNIITTTSYCYPEVKLYMEYNKKTTSYCYPEGRVRAWNVAP